MYVFFLLLLVVWYHIWKAIGHEDYPMFSLFDFTFRSFIHFELIFVYSVRQGSHVILCGWLLSSPLLGDACSAGELCSRMKPPGSQVHIGSVLGTKHSSARMNGWVMSIHPRLQWGHMCHESETLSVKVRLDAEGDQPSSSGEPPLGMSELIQSCCCHTFGGGELPPFRASHCRGVLLTWRKALPCAELKSSSL